MDKKHGPWIIHGSKQIYKNEWIEVREDEVTRPDGKSGVFATVIMVPGVSVLPMDKEGNVYLEKQFRYAVGRETVEAVAGGINEGEEAIAAAKREMEEELGIRASKFTQLGYVDPLTSAIKTPAYLFLAQDLTFVDAHQGGDEVIELMKVPFDRAVEMVMKSEITHAQSCIVILKAKEFLKL